ncbi:transcription termination factor 4, mitochondrial isoform X2 [Carcharodon carcharias]|uniref:transcription termination factor 4, mitochondrial isoform X2 n=1 Tax=Carcharodon carcharias TaxID=13397 RepID=UPI001B7E9B4D|nr:transcription termination factor 4, mitochondrial isoform X2 [Carcharodon carcharias]
MSRSLKEVTQQAVRLHCFLQRTQPLVGYWQLLSTQKYNTQNAGPWRYISCGFPTAGTLSQSEETSPDSLSAPKIKPELLEALRQTAAKNFGKSDIDTSGFEIVAESILKLGFSQVQVKQLLALNPRIAVQPPQKSLPALYMLSLLGLNPSSTLKVLEKCPELFGAKDHQLQSRIDNLQKHGLGEGSLQRVLLQSPQILNLSAKQVNNTVRFLKDKCIFTGQQITEILQTSPNILFEKSEELEYKFQYAYFRMGIKQSEMTKSGLFRVSLEELKQRHIFLERLGFYQTPDKKGQTQIINPKAKDILTTSEDYFLAKVARSSWEEFDIFKKLLSHEEVEKEELESTEWEDEEESEKYSSEEDEGPLQGK